MGRQKGDPNRSKNRPSSSSAAASLLQSSKGIPAGFGGYVGSSRVDVSELQDNEVPWDVDSEAALHLRRLSKKDSTTRMKALKALIILFKERPANELCQLLPTWIFGYKKLVHDDNQQVRENTHNAMFAISTTVGRGLAPHIRTLMGAWWVSQFDPAKEVSAASQQSFQAAFQGPSKRLEALMFCATDVLSYIDSLLKLSPQTISEKHVPIEESTKKYELVISSALLALAAFLDAILQGWKPISTLGNNDSIEPDKEKPNNKRNQERKKEIEDSAAKLCLNYKHFRDFLKSKSSQIRCASYQALYSFARNVSSTFSAKDLEDNAGIVLGSFAEKDPSCHSAMWDMILYFSKRYPEMWNTSATNKFIMPRLFSFLRHATYGSAKVSYPCILPLLSLLPSQTMNLSVQFLKDLFSSLWDGHDLCHLGLENEIVFLKTFQECFLWAINNADRFSAGHESSLVDSIQGYMMENVFIEILWKNYTFCGFQAPSDSLPPAVTIKNKNNASKGALEVTHKKHKERYSNEFIEKLRNCMIDILVILAAKFRTVVRSFWKLFPEICFQAITFEASQMIASTSAERIGCAQRVSEFLSLIGRSSPSEESYKHDILDMAVRPLVAKLLPFVKIMDFGDAILLLAAIVSTFGPLSFHTPEDIEQGEVFDSDLNEGNNNKDLDVVFSFMEKNLIPWCLEPCKFCLAEKVDLLLSFFEDKRLTSKWNSVISHAIMINDTESDSGELHSGKIAVLSVLLERFRLKFLDLDIEESCSTQETRQWDLSGLDGAAVIVARSLSLSDPSALLFLRQVLGGSRRTVLRLLVAQETVGAVIKILLQRFVYILLNSGKEWACFAAAQLSMPDLDQPLSFVEDEKAASLAFAAAQALCENITDLQFVNEPEATTRVVASFYCIQWAFNCEDFLDEEEEKVQFDYEGKGEESPPVPGTYSGSRGVEDGTPEDCVESPVDHGFMAESVKHMVRNISLILSSGYPGCLTTSIRIGVQRIMIQCIRYAAFEGTTDAQKMACVCSNWITTLMDELCMKAEDTQYCLDMLLEPTVAWPLYASKPSKSKNCTVPGEERLQLSSETVKHERFSALIGKMAMLLGWEKLVGRQRTETAESCRPASKGKSLELEEHCRIWLVIEMLCTWVWPGGGATDSLIPYLMACVDNDQNFSEDIVDSVIYSLFTPAKSKEMLSNFSNKYWLGSIDNLEDCEDRCLHALLFLLSKICQADKKVEYSEKLFQMLVVEQGYLEDPLSFAGLQMLPFILSILVPALRKKQDGIDSSIRSPITLKVAALKWLGAAYSAPPLCMQNAFVPDLENALQVVVACFPLHSAGGSVAVMAAASANVSTEEMSLLKSLMQKEASEVAGFVAHVAKQYASQSENSFQQKDARQFHEEILAKLIASSIVYCWKQFSNQEWAIVTHHMRKWMEAALIEIGNFTELVNSTILEKKGSKELPLSILEKITAGIETIYGKKSDLSWTAAIIFSLLEALQCSTFTGSQSSVDHLELFNWKEVKDRALNYMAQMFFASGMSEALASDSIAGDAAANLVASYHKSNIQFWEVVSEILLGTSIEERKGIGRHLNTWTVGKDPIRSLYALLFSSQPIGRMQHAAFSLLTKDPFQTLAVICRERKVGPAEERLNTESPSLTDAAVRPELSRILEISPSKIHESALMSSIRVRYFLAWAIILSYLGSISVSSEVGQKLVQYIQDSALSSTILDSILQHIPLNSEQGSYKKKPSSLCQAEMGKIGDAARRACAVRTATFAIEELWPIDQHTVSSLAAALYGLLLQVLPAFVRVWFAGLRDRSVASSVDYFTTKFCSPLLLADEFAQVHNSTIQDDSLTIKANQGLGEITVIYKKEEAGMDMTIKLPKCYPLKAVDIDCTRRLGVSETRLRKWTLSMAAFLRNQNGAVAEAIQIWRQNVDREFEGVEECPICYSIIHTANHSLPKLACKTCKHKFHAPCLYKWFSTSHKSTCPLCQTPF